MDEKKIKRRKGVKRISLNIRVSEALSNWLKDHNYSPTAIFNESCKGLGYKEPNGN